LEKAKIEAKIILNYETLQSTHLRGGEKMRLALFSQEKRWILGIICIAILCALMFVGLWAMGLD